MTELLFHWSPSVRRGQIQRYGLRPSMPSTTSTGWRAGYICFAESPSWAWALSGYFHPEIESWDLWQTNVDRLREPELKPSYDDHHWHEVRTEYRVYKRDLWFVGVRLAS